MTQVVANRRTEPLSAHRLFETRNIELARHTVSQKFCAHALHPGRSHRDFDTCHNHAPGLNLSLNYLRYGCDISIDPGELGSFYLIQIPVSGAAVVKNGTRRVEASPKVATVLNATRATTMTWNSGCEKILLQIDRAALHRTAEALTGQSLNHAIVFDPEVYMQAKEVRFWMSKLHAAIAVAQNGDAFGAAMHRHQALLEEELISAFLTAQPNSISHMLENREAAPSLGTLRRARSFIAENLTEPITVSDVAAIAGCSVRSLQLGFQQNFGCSPMHYLRRRRLDVAHHLLRVLPPETLVRSVAQDVGFTHLGRFSSAYRAAFGQSPRDTQVTGQIA